jgi:transcription initiation factor TFIIIB Brf1 subunit/transcription initiation factor TFIIB
VAKRIDERVNTVSPEQYLKFAQELVVADRDIRKATEVLAQAPSS